MGSYYRTGTHHRPHQAGVIPMATEELDLMVKGEMVYLELRKLVATVIPVSRAMDMME